MCFGGVRGGGSFCFKHVMDLSKSNLQQNSNEHHSQKWKYRNRRSPCPTSSKTSAMPIKRPIRFVPTWAIRCNQMPMSHRAHLSQESSAGLHFDTRLTNCEPFGTPNYLTLGPRQKGSSARSQTTPLIASPKQCLLLNFRGGWKEEKASTPGRRGSLTSRGNPKQL